MTRLHRLATAAALAALTAIALTPTLAAAKPKPKQQPRATAAARFDVVRVDVRGDHRSRLVDDLTVYDYRGIARYETTVDEQGTLVVPPPAKRRLPRAFVIRPLEYNGLSDAKITMRGGVDDCSRETSGAEAPTSLVGLVAFAGARMHVNWILHPPQKRCPPNALIWTIAAPPSKAMVQRYKLGPLLRARRGREVRLPIRIAHRWSDVFGDHSVRWTGYVLLERVR